MKRFFIGTPLTIGQIHQEKLSKRKALSVFSSDALSSVAYATEEVLMVLVLTGTAFLSYSVPISIAIVGLLFLVVFSYRQTIYSYPGGGGAYIVAKENLGQRAGLVAGAAILIDYVLTVAVSAASGVAAFTSAFPSLHEYNVLICVLAIAILTFANLRGMKESATMFMMPTYFFIGCVFLMLGVGFYKMMMGEFSHEDAKLMGDGVSQPFTLFLLLRAFSSGCTAMTGVEAVSDSVPAFQSPESKNASTTLVAMSLILAAMFIGITWLSHYHGIVPHPDETVLSQLGRSIFGKTGLYYALQFTTMGILFLAANTSYADFPRLSAFLAKDRFLPRQLASLGDRLVFSNGVLMLGGLSAVLVVFFKAETHALIPLYAVGVFLSFTLSQAGMFRHFLRERKKGWKRHSITSFIGMIATGVVLMIFIITKFTQGAWAILVLIPLIIYMFRNVYRHYLSVGKQLSLIGIDPSAYKDEIKHTVLIPMSGIHKGVLEALRYARSIANDVRAVYVEIDPSTTARVQEEWKKWGQGVPLVVLKSPYRSIIAPLLKYVDDVEELEHDDMLTLIIPEFVTARWWQNLMHNQSALLIRASLSFKKRKVVTSIRYHLE